MNSTYTWILVGAVALFFLITKSKSIFGEKEVSSVIQKGSKIVDVRSPGEFSTGHYPGAVNIPVDQVQSRISEFGDKTQPIVVYCASGGRSSSAKRLLEAAGYTNVTNGGGLRDMPR